MQRRARPQSPQSLRGDGCARAWARVRRAKGQVMSVSLRENSFPLSFSQDLFYSEIIYAVVFLKACNLQNRLGGQDEGSGILISTWRARYLGPRRHADATAQPPRPLPSPPRSPWREKRPLPSPPAYPPLPFPSPPPYSRFPLSVCFYRPSLILCSN